MEVIGKVRTAFFLCMLSAGMATIAVAETQPADPTTLEIDGRHFDTQLGADHRESTFVVIPKRTGDYVVLIDAERLGLSPWLSNSSGVPFGYWTAHVLDNGTWQPTDSNADAFSPPQSDKRPTYFHTIATLQALTPYSITVRSIEQVPSDLHYRISVYRKDPSYLPTDAIKMASEVVVSESLMHLAPPGESSPDYYRSGNATFYRLRMSTPDMQWVTVKFAPGTYPPHIYFFDPRDGHVIDPPYSSQTKDQFIITQKVTGEEVGLIIADPWGLFNSRVERSIINESIDIAGFVQDPSARLFGRIRDFLSDPSVGTTTGIVVGGLISWLVSWLYYRLAVARKRLMFSVRDDVTLMHQQSATDSHLQVSRNGVPVTRNLCWCRTEIQFRSNGDLCSADVSEPVSLKLENCAGILRAVADATDGWKGISLIGTDELPVEIGLEFLHLTPGDRMLLQVFYLQDEIKPISISARGRLVNGSFSKSANLAAEDKFATFVVTLGWVIVCAAMLSIESGLIYVLTNPLWQLASLALVVGTFLALQYMQGRRFHLFLHNKLSPRLLRIMSWSGANPQSPLAKKFEVEPAH